MHRSSRAVICKLCFVASIIVLVPAALRAGELPHAAEMQQVGSTVEAPAPPPPGENSPPAKPPEPEQSEALEDEPSAPPAGQEPKRCVWVAAWAPNATKYNAGRNYGEKTSLEYMREQVRNIRGEDVPSCFDVEYGTCGHVPAYGATVIRAWCRRASARTLAAFLKIPLQMYRTLPKDEDATMSWYMDENCRYAPPSNDVEVCGFAGVSWSPISLIWDDSIDLDANVSVVSFSLAAYKPESYSLWKASAAAPLLVFDPRGSGKVISARQLFGNFAFGGRTVSVSDFDHPELRAGWENGFEALALLDTDRNGAVSGSELKPLALWFDNNRDAQVDAGELRRVNDEGITAIYFRGYQKQPHSEDLKLAIGYERHLNGKLVRGAAVDWFAETFETKQEAVLALHSLYKPDTDLAGMPKGFSAEALQTLSAESPLDFVPPKSSDHASDVSGFWVWRYNEDAKRSSPGIFAFEQASDGTISGYNVIEMPLESNDRGLRSGVKLFPVSGSNTAAQRGQSEVLLQMRDTTGSALAESSAQLSKDGLFLTGQTRQTFVIDRDGQHRSASVVYDWIAQKVRVE